MGDILLERMRQRAEDLETAYRVNEVAHKAHTLAEKQWSVNKCEQNAHALVTTEAGWDDARDEIVLKAQYMLGTLAILLASMPYDDHPTLGLQAAYLKEAFREETSAFNRYNRHETDELRQTWQDARGAIIDRARPLATLVKGIAQAGLEGHSPTHTDSHHAAQN